MKPAAFKLVLAALSDTGLSLTLVLLCWSRSAGLALKLVLLNASACLAQRLCLVQATCSVLLLLQASCRTIREDNWTGSTRQSVVCVCRITCRWFF
ncbi:hypothetical protein JB92DRAFT_2988025, partial [Gautieria morchelliformis]